MFNDTLEKEDMKKIMKKVCENIDVETESMKAWKVKIEYSDCETEELTFISEELAQEEKKLVLCQDSDAIVEIEEVNVTDLSDVWFG